MGLKSLDDLLTISKDHQNKKLVVAAAEDEHVMLAIKQAREYGLIEPILIGDASKISEISKNIDFKVSGIEIIDEPVPEDASFKAVEMIKNGEANILMKGLVSTGALLTAVLQKDSGLRKAEVLSHIALFETPYYHKLLAVTDAAMNIAPNFNEKIAILRNAIELFHKLGTELPKVGIIGAVEIVNPRMEATTDAALLSVMNKRGQIKGCLVDGPLALDNAVSKDAAKLKNIEGAVAGDVDIIIAPEINAGNILYKSLNFLGVATGGAVIMGASVPVVLTSRADSQRSKLMSIAMATAMKET